MISEQGAQAICTVFPIAILLIVIDAARIQSKKDLRTRHAVWRLVVSVIRLLAVFAAAYSIFLAIVALSQNRSMNASEAIVVWCAGVLLFALALDIMGSLIGQTLFRELDGWAPWRADRERRGEIDSKRDRDQ